jgi:uncharacterized MAPEG superfamily protein
MLSPAIPLWCLLIAALMPYVIVAMAKSSADYDNDDPRNMAGFQTPFRRRAHGAHLNCLEAFAFFAVAVLLALVQHVPAATLSLLALLWLLFRLVYVVLYLTGRGTLRSLVWFAASFASIAIYLAAIFH